MVKRGKEGNESNAHNEQQIQKQKHLKEQVVEAVNSIMKSFMPIALFTDCNCFYHYIVLAAPCRCYSTLNFIRLRCGFKSAHNDKLNEQKSHSCAEQRYMEGKLEL